jgi:imidazole glycerol-phosphate synthase subunit HisF
MLKKRVIFTLLFKDGFFVLSRNFRLQKVGDLHWLKENYNFGQTAFVIDELIILDVSRDKKNEVLFCEYVKSLTEECFIPIAAGGGIKNVKDAKNLLRNGADKIVINTLAAQDNDEISKIASEFGRQSIVVSIDAMKIDNHYRVLNENAEKLHDQDLRKYLERINKLPIGEIYLNSIDKDGTGQGFQNEILDELPVSMSIPLIFAGGAGNHLHLAEGLKHDAVDAVATANLFNFVGDGLKRARENLLKEGFDLAEWDIATANSLKSCLT